VLIEVMKKIGDGLLFLRKIGQDWRTDRRSENFAISEKIYYILSVPEEISIFSKSCKKVLTLYVQCGKV